jgi:hypothetical protein
MAFPVRNTVQKAVNATSATSISMTVTECVIGQSVLVIAVGGNSSADALTSPTAGWTKVGFVGPNSTTQIALFHKIATATSEAITVNNSSSGTNVLVAIPYAANSGNVSASYFNPNTLASNVDCPLHNPGVARDYEWLAVGGHRGGVTASAAPTGYSDLITQSSTGSASVSGTCSMARRQLNASSEDPGTFTNSSVRSVSATVAVWGDSSGEPPPVVERRAVRSSFWF